MKIDLKKMKSLINSKFIIKEKRILDRDKYYYWNTVSEEHAEAMLKAKKDKNLKLYYTNFYHSLKAEQEKLKYCVPSSSDKRVLKLLIETFNKDNNIEKVIK